MCFSSIGVNLIIIFFSQINTFLALSIFVRPYHTLTPTHRLTITSQLSHKVSQQSATRRHFLQGIQASRQLDFGFPVLCAATTAHIDFFVIGTHLQFLSYTKPYVKSTQFQVPCPILPILSAYPAALKPIPFDNNPMGPNGHPKHLWRYQSAQSRT